MNAYVYHYVRTLGSISCGYLGKYKFLALPRVGDYVHYRSEDDVDTYIISEIIFNLKKFGRTEIIIHVENVK